MQNMLVAIILAIVVVGLLIPPFRKDMRATRESFPGQKPESAFTRLFKKLKDRLFHD